MSLPMSLPMCSPGGALLLPMCSPPMSLPMCSHPFLHLMFSPNRITACALLQCLLEGMLPSSYVWPMHAGKKCKAVAFCRGHWRRAVASCRASLDEGCCLQQGSLVTLWRCLLANKPEPLLLALDSLFARHVLGQRLSLCAGIIELLDGGTWNQKTKLGGHHF